MLVAELEEEVEALSPVVRVAEAERRTSSADQAGAERGLGRGDGGVDLVAGTNHVAPVDERVARTDSDALVDLHADVQAELRHPGKLVAGEVADVGRQGQQGALAVDR